MIATARPYLLPGHIVIPEPHLRFGSNAANDIDIHPMEGLLRFGPYSLDKLSAVSNPIRVGIIVPTTLEEPLIRQMRELDQSHRPRSAKPICHPFQALRKCLACG